jgi:hypothetical protein
MITTALVLVATFYLIFRPVMEFASRNRVDYARHLSFPKSDTDWVAMQRLVGMPLCENSHGDFYLRAGIWFASDQRNLLVSYPHRRTADGRYN